MEASARVGLIGLSHQLWRLSRKTEIEGREEWDEREMKANKRVRIKMNGEQVREASGEPSRTDQSRAEQWPIACKWML